MTAPTSSDRIDALRILHCISSVNPAQGGPIEGIRQLTRVNQSLGRTVEVVCLDAPDAPWLAAMPMKVHALGPTQIGKWSYSPRLKPWLQANAANYDLVIVNGIWQYHAFGAWRALHRTRTPYFVFTHGMLDPWFKRTYPLKHLKKWLFWPWAEYRVLRDAAAVMFTCEQERLLARESFWLYRCQEFVTRYGTNGPPVDDAAGQREAFLRRFPDLRHTRNLLFLGRVHEKKGTDLLLKALAQVRQERPDALHDVRLVMAGPADHDFGLAMQRLGHDLGLDDLMVWTGMVQGAEKWGAFRTSEAFVLPSHQENFGIAVAESLACGTPVLISDQVNIWREIDQAGAGLVEPDTLAGTVRLLQRWLDTPVREWQLKRNRASACFSRHFNIDRAAESLGEAWQRFGVPELAVRAAGTPPNGGDLSADRLS